MTYCLLSVMYLHASAQTYQKVQKVTEERLDVFWVVSSSFMHI